MIPFITGKDNYHIESTKDFIDSIDRTGEIFFLLNVMFIRKS